MLNWHFIQSILIGSAKKSGNNAKLFCLLDTSKADAIDKLPIRIEWPKAVSYTHLTLPTKA